LGGTAGDLPLIGDGTGRWYAPASLRLDNPTETDREVGVAVDGDDPSEAGLLDYRYLVPRNTGLTVPLAYRSGRYTVRVTDGDVTRRTRWPVPEVPVRYVTLGPGPPAYGCGPAVTTLRVSNLDGDPHRVTVTVVGTADGGAGRGDGGTDGTGDGTVSPTGSDARSPTDAVGTTSTAPSEGPGPDRTTTETFDLAPEADAEFVPFVESGRYEVEAVLDTGRSDRATWWACPPRGPATVVVDATGAVTVRAGGPSPG
jgi:hypothetical protein